MTRPCSNPSAPTSAGPSGSRSLRASPGTDRSGSGEPSLSGDGRYVLFAARSLLVTSDTDAFADLYRLDRATVATALASIDSWAAGSTARRR
jgi:hypothetical protein